MNYNNMLENIPKWVNQFSKLDTPCVSDALDSLGIVGQAYGIMPLQDYKTTLVGPAFTVKYTAAAKPAGTVGDYIDDVAAGSIIVIDNDARTDCTVWGDILTQYALQKQISATVIDGVCRDVNRAINNDYPVFSKGRFMRTGKDRVQVESINSVISIGQARVAPNDLVVADANGVVIVPLEYVSEVLAAAHTIHSAEEKIRQCLKSGDSIKVARDKLNYHTLQRK